MIRHGGGVPGVLYNQVGGQLWHLKTHFEFYPFLKNRGGSGRVSGGSGVVTVIRGGRHYQGMTYTKGDKIQ